MSRNKEVEDGIEMVNSIVQKHFLSLEKARELEEQRAVFYGERDITNVLTEAQEKARLRGESFEPDLESAENRAKHLLKFGVEQRLRGAYACYRAGKQLECLRHILLALDTVCCTLGWDKASAYIHEQNRVLLKLPKMRICGGTSRTSM